MREHRQGWDRAAKEDAMYHIADRKSWTRYEFLAAGIEDAKNFTREFFATMDFQPSGKRMLDIGCGIGRMSRAFAEMFSAVYGVDFSPEMVKRAKEINGDKSNLFFAVNNGLDLCGFANSYFDFCFSYAMFQHIHDVRVIEGYIREIGRVLKPGGLFRFNIDGRKWGPASMPIMHRTLYNLLLRAGLISKLAKLYFGRGLEAYAYPGVWLSKAKLKAMVRQSGLEVLEISGKGLVWCSGRKPLG